MEDKIPYMHTIRPYENNSPSEIDSDPKEGGGGRGSKIFPNQNRRKVIFLIK